MTSRSQAAPTIAAIVADLWRSLFETMLDALRAALRHPRMLRFSRRGEALRDACRGDSRRVPREVGSLSKARSQAIGTHALCDARCARGGFVKNIAIHSAEGRKRAKVAPQASPTDLTARIAKKPSIHSWDNRRVTMIAAASLCVFCEFAEAFSHELESI